MAGAVPYKQTTVSAPGAPSTTSKFDLDVMQPLLYEIVVKNPINEPQIQHEMSSARSFFTGEGMIQADTIMQNLKYGQKYKLNIRKQLNPLGLFNKTAVNYNTVDDCHDQIALDCTLPCVNTLPAFQQLVFAFDTIYSYGVRACDLNKEFWDFDFFTQQYQLSREAEQFGREVDLWNKVIDTLVNSPAQTVDAIVAAKHATHYWSSMGTITANGRDAITEAYWYLKNSYGDIRPTVFITDEAAHELIRAEETVYNRNFATQRVNTYKDWDMASGFQISSAVETIFGGDIPVVIMKRSPYLTYVNEGSGATGMTSYYPLYNDDATCQYVAILDPRVGYSFERPYYHLTINPYDCDKLDRGIQDFELVGTGVTFPQLGLVMSFDMSTWV